MEQILSFIKNNFILLIQTAVWIFSIVGTFIFEPLLENSDSNTWVNFSRFIMAAVIGLSYFLLFKYNRKKDTRLWIIVSCVTLLVCIYSYFQYRSFFESKTIRIPKAILDVNSIGNNDNFLRYTIGDNLRDSSLIKLRKEKNRYISLEEFFSNFAPGETMEEKLSTYYPEDEIKFNINVIFFLYTFNLLVFTLLIISLMQGIKCVSIKNKSIQ